MVRLQFGISVVATLSALLLIDANNNDMVDRCVTPIRQDASCVSLFSCPGLIKLLSTLTPSAIKFVKRSICSTHKPGDLLVCCSHANMENSSGEMRPQLIDTTNTPPLSSESKRDLLPDRRYCGYQHTDDRYYNETATALDEFPWIVHVKHSDVSTHNKPRDRCTGVLINHRYVLTEKVCSFSAFKVRLGQYDVSNRFTCTENPDEDECNEGTIEIRVLGSIDVNTGVIETYSLSLLRLAKRVDYSDFIRPICLPFVGTTKTSPSQQFIVSGWGFLPTSSMGDSNKKRFVYNVAPMVTCAERSGFLSKFVQTDDHSLLCLIPSGASTDVASYRDRGGPLMYANKKHQWFVEAVVVAVLHNKISKANPIVAMKITPVLLDSIVESIEP